jgi:lipopolysaccharide/colanic/teichoic acid biosynthesis glycosyltransferase
VTKRILDLAIAILALTLLSPLLLPVCFLVWLQDRHSPFYIAPRVGKNGAIFRMVKVRSMIKGADRSGVESTAADDRRITALGHFVRRYKIDELGQLWNVLTGDMSLVGPRPNTTTAVTGYSDAERGLLAIKPGITDFSSIVFSDEGEILRNEADPDNAYDKLIRPWKSRLGLLYVEKHNVLLDLKILVATALAIFNKPKALSLIARELKNLEAAPELLAVSKREMPMANYVGLAGAQRD